MTREDLEEEIQRRLRSTEEYESSEPNDIVCQQCGSLIEQGEKFVAYGVPEHGTDSMGISFFCEESCFIEFFEDLVDV